MISAGTSWRISGERIVSAQMRTAGMGPSVTEVGTSFPAPPPPSARRPWGTSSARAPPGRAAGRRRPASCAARRAIAGGSSAGNNLAARLGDDPARLGARRERDDRAAGREVLEELEVEQLAAAWAEASSSRASAARCSASARLARQGAGEHDPGRRDVGLQQRRSSSVSGPGDHELEPRPPRRAPRARARAQRLDEPGRVAPVAAEAARVDERRPLGVEQAVRSVGWPRRRRVELGVPAVRDQQRGRAEPLARRSSAAGAADDDDGVGGAEPAALEPLVEAALERASETRGRSGSKFHASRMSATHGTPRRRQRPADQVRRLRRRAS